MLDYVWFTDKLVVPVRGLQIPEEKTLRCFDDSPLPNSQYPSDHVALCFGFALR